MIFGEWDEEAYREVMKREAFEDGAEANARKTAQNLLGMNILTPHQIAQAVSLPLEEILALKAPRTREPAAY